MYIILPIGCSSQKHILAVHADGKRAAPDSAVAQDAGSLSSQERLEEGDVAVRLLSPAAEAPVDEEFEADFAALMEAHQASTCRPSLVSRRCACTACKVQL